VTRKPKRKWTQRSVRVDELEVGMWVSGEIRRCPHCGDTFLAHRAGTVWCTHQCRNAAGKMRKRNFAEYLCRTLG